MCAVWLLKVLGKGSPLFSHSKHQSNDLLLLVGFCELKAASEKAFSHGSFKHLYLSDKASLLPVQYC